LQDDEDEEEDPFQEEEHCRRAMEETIGGLLKNNPNAFVQYTEDIGKKLQQWLSSKDNMVLGLHLACDCLENLREKSHVLWPVFMSQVFNGIGDKDADVRTAAAYAINLAATIAQFREAAPDAFRRVAQVVTGPNPKKKDDSAKIAMDNAVAALFTLAFEQGDSCPQEVDAFFFALKRMPLKEDWEEAKKVHKKLATNLMAQHAGLIGANKKNLGQVLSVLIEVYKQENISEKELDDQIAVIFKQLGQNLQEYKSSFTEKQQKKIEKLLSS
jgi:hypothetical protein